MGKFKLIYFDARGGGEVARWILSAGKADWEDVRIKQEDWPKKKPDTPNGQLPVMECENDGKKGVITQSSTIARALANTFNMAGEDMCQRVQADETWETMRDVVQKFYEGVMEKDESKKPEKMKAMEECLLKNLAFLEKKLVANGGKWIAGGDKMTYADIAVACFLDAIHCMGVADCEKAKAAAPGIMKVCCAVKENPEIKAWIAKRPQTKM